MKNMIYVKCFENSPIYSSNKMERYVWRIK
ncbi:hypothetical protein IMSAGC003_00262 [Lachnospiraceae bacterium]|nr:hypothetical protein IMSAGC003_00262 [Lachnospiraceae bacterium]